MSRETRGLGMLLICSAIWGFTFVAQRLGADHLGAFAFTAARGWLGAVALLPLVAMLDRRAYRTRAERIDAWRAVVRPGVFIGLMLTGGQSLQQLGIEQTTAGTAAFVTGLYMVLVPIAGVLMGHRTGLFTWLGVGLAVPGLFLLTWTGSGIGPGDLLVLVGTVFWTLQILGVSRAARRVDPIRLSVAQFAVMAAVCTVIAPLPEPDPFAGLVPALGAELFAGILSTGVAFTLQVLGQRHVRTPVAAMVMSLETMWGAIGGALVLGERFTVSGLIGSGMMLAGILLAQVPARDDVDAAPVLVPEPVPHPKDQ